MSAQLCSVMAAMVLVCVADDVVLPWHSSFMDARCDLSANNARFSGLIRRSLSPCWGTVSDGGWGVVMLRSWSLAMSWFVCLVGGDRRITMSAGHLEGASGMSPVGSIAASQAALVLLLVDAKGVAAG
jgi:hypothetical protein